MNKYNLTLIYQNKYTVLRINSDPEYQVMYKGFLLPEQANSIHNL